MEATWRPGREPNGAASLTPSQPESHGAASPSPASPASPYLYPGLRISGLTPSIVVGAKAMLPLGNRNKCPVNTPPLCPQGVEYAKGVLLEPPSNQLQSRGGSGVSVDTENHLPHPV